MKSIFTAVVALSCAVILFAGGVALAQTNWLDELTGSVNFYKSRYPGTNAEPANWDPYLNKLSHMKKSAIRGDRETVRVEMSQWFKMLKDREGGINPKAADELFRIAVLATPFDEYKIAVPAQ